MNFNAKEYIGGKVLRYVKHNKKIIIDFSDGIGLNKTYRFIFNNGIVNKNIDLLGATIIDLKKNISFVNFLFLINKEKVEITFKADKIYEEIFLTDDLYELYNKDSNIYQKKLENVLPYINKEVYKIFNKNLLKLTNYHYDNDLIIGFNNFSLKFLEEKTTIIHYGIEITFDRLLELFNGNIFEKEVHLRIKKCRYGIEIGILLDLIRKIEIIIKCKSIELIT